MAGKHTRRNVLQKLGAAGIAATSIALAGCSSQASNSGGETENDGGSGGTTTTEDSSSGGESGGATQTDTVGMTEELGFDPKTIEVPVGTTVTFDNTSSIGHSVTAYEDKIPDGAAYFATGGFDSEQAAKDAYPDKGNLEAGETYEHTFETKGTYEYYCIPHEMNGMVGTIEVV
ncbi:copper-binding protein (plasmid) [Haloferax mediterranei ATCC 33500]|uniref:Copper-binding plastocyanin like protein n=1 Tax=Haloferax mediterranei (strain ATCC 33500 / DSM 1411 / JCM 8866 / NBRC 14739 / NCIMB 2177 / R-4) TaxID=523841 RepID=I3R9L7_HALMT|nr:plastocyanin/azurin family copper-binding protein [Haloferax mediterranei]AFK20927.1 copper-binding plastocyanin like protein [Haloferax mediterranei ATCC 33500]AHZ24204.1 copper-binding protein [Haloferax mediterranei ATCC 33500]EMA05283.1 copper-binding plastocyanin like protein [Haloferax mediterranei ATCC 33500]MDX5989915.1 plastocyanin/azurin family copper-binding protein [Haloferax mediterranei ATCC 33500]QCQ77107.1 copper-binding protein [Haloferax mediterranei ATCC 33500]